ncbi:hypothetical protein HYZ80_03630 [Candidatus Parcubacteria bacterium]|nr:hypothetical protein [Candidatus Parcubacteria bacterium]
MIKSRVETSSGRPAQATCATLLHAAMKNFLDYIKNLDFRKYLVFLIPAVLIYFFASNVFQSRLTITNFDMLDAYPGYPILPEPYEIPLYLLSFIAVPLLTLVFYRLWSYPAIRFAVGLLVGAGAVALLVKIAQMHWPSVATAFDYLATRRTSHVLWLVTTKRLYAVRLAMATSVAALIFFYWKPLQFRWLTSRENPRLKTLLFLLLVMLGVVVFDPNFTSQEGFTNFVLSPAHEMLNGKPLLYDTTSVYGVLSVYLTAFLIKFFLPLSYKSMSLIIMVAYFGFYFLLYKALKIWTQSSVFSLLGTWLAVVVGYFLLVSPYIAATSYIGQTAYRQGFYLIIFYFLVRWWQTHSRATRELIFLFSALGLFWNIDTGVYIAIATFASLAYVLLTERSTRSARSPDSTFQKFKKVFSLGVHQFLYIFGVFAVISLVNYLMYHSWPNWLLEIADISTFNTGYGKILMPQFGIFEIYLFVYLGFLAWIVWKFVRKEVVPLPVVFLTTYGIFSFIYYVGNSAWSYLNFISIPMLMLLLYFFYQFFREQSDFLPRRLMAAGLGALLFFASIVTMVKIPVVFANRNYADISLTSIDAADEPLYQDAIYLRGHFPDTRLAVLHETDGKLLVMADKINYFYLQSGHQRLYSLYDNFLMIYRRHTQGISLFCCHSFFPGLAVSESRR